MDVKQLHEEWMQVNDYVEKVAWRRSRHLQGAEREDFVQETIALSYTRYLSLQKRGMWKPCMAWAVANKSATAHLFGNRLVRTCGTGRCCENGFTRPMNRQQRWKPDVAVDSETVLNALGTEVDPAGLACTMVDLEDFLGRLMPRERLVLIMRLEGWTHREIARFVGHEKQWSENALGAVRAHWEAFMGTEDVTTSLQSDSQ